MATCKDCLYSTICKTYASFGVTDLPYNDETICELFKNKADVVEVVMCKDCKYLKVYNNDNVYAECEKIHLLFRPFETDTREHFCGFGERKCDNE